MGKRYSLDIAWMSRTKTGWNFLYMPGQDERGYFLLKQFAHPSLRLQINGLHRLHGNMCRNMRHLNRRASMMNKHEEEHKPEETKTHSDGHTHSRKKALIRAGRIFDGREHDQAIGRDTSEAPGPHSGTAAFQQPTHHTRPILPQAPLHP